MQPVTGGETMVGRFEIVRRLGAGGMGEVYEARDPQLKRHVALKRVPPDVARIGETRNRLLIEARAAARISHQGIATLYDVLESGDELYLVMEYVDGKTLRQIPTPMPLDDFLDLALQATAAIEAAHARDVVHGDIKPDNLMLTADGKLKVLDFGVAGLMAPVGENDPTTMLAAGPPGSTGMTLSYAAPEVLRGRRCDHRADLFSLGLVLYELVSGRHPFGGKTATETAARIVSEELPPIVDIDDRVPVEIAAILEKLLAKEPDDRYGSAADLGADLEALRATGGLGPATGALPSPTVPRSRLSSGPALIALLAVILGAGGTILARYWPSAESAATDTAAPSGAPVATVDFDPTQWVIAVLPFAASGESDPAIDALNEGLAMTLTTRLARLSRERGLQVIPAGLLRELGIETIEGARTELGVSLAISYATRRLGDRDLRVATTLIDVAAKRQLDADTIDGTVDDLITLEERVALQVLGMLRLEIEPDEQGSFAPGTGDPAAYELFLRGQGFLADFTDPDKVDAAIDTFRQALQLDPNYADAHAVLGTAFWRRFGHTSEPIWVERARQECRRAEELDDRDALAHVCLGLLYLGTGEPEAAADAFSRALALDPTLDVAYVELGRAYEALNKPELAEETYRDAIAARPHYWGGHNWLGAFLLNRGRLDEAIASFEEVVRLAPDSYGGYRNLGTAHYFAEDWDEARELFERALEIRPDDQRTLSNLATLYFFQRRYADAARTYERAAELDENNYFRWGNLADAYYWAPGERDKAADTYRRAIELAAAQLEVNPRDDLVLMDVAFYHAMLGEEEPAIRHIERALEVAPDDSFVQLQAAKVYHRLGDDDAALNHLATAVGAGYAVAEIRADPVFDDLAGEARFEAVLEAGRR